MPTGDDVAKGLSGLKIDNALDEEWSPRIPPELIYSTIDDFLLSDLPTIRSLVLTCQALRAHCRPYLFRTLVFPNQITSKRLAKFASLLRTSPEIAVYVKAFILDFLPVSSVYVMLQLLEVKPLIAILTQKYPALQYVRITAKSVAWDRLAPQLQHALLLFLRTKSIFNLSLAMKTFPLALAEQSQGAAIIHLCGNVVPNTEEPRLPPIEGKVKPQSLTLCHTPDTVFALLSDVKNSIVSPQSIRTLSLGRTETFSPAQYHLMRAAGPTLESCQMEIATLAQPAPIPFSDLPKLQQLLLTIDANEIYKGLWFLSASLEQSPFPNGGTPPRLNICLKSETSDRCAAFSRHHATWREASKLQHLYPKMAELDISGWSVMAGETTMRCLGGYKAGGHGHEGCGDKGSGDDHRH